MEDNVILPPNVAGAYGGKRSGKDLPYDPDQWSTPQWLFDELNAKYRFTLDAAASHENHKCPLYFTKEEDGLKQSWRGHRVFINVPFSQTEWWLEKAYSERDGAFACAIFKADTSTKWFRNKVWPWCKAFEADIDFLPRIQFVPPPGYVSKSGNTKPGSPNMGHATLTLGMKNLMLSDAELEAMREGRNTFEEYGFFSVATEPPTLDGVVFNRFVVGERE
jgi:phage N-6-adenine-methyltransferase